MALGGTSHWHPKEVDERSRRQICHIGRFSWGVNDVGALQYSHAQALSALISASIQLIPSRRGCRRMYWNACGACSTLDDSSQLTLLQLWFLRYRVMCVLRQDDRRLELPVPRWALSIPALIPFRNRLTQEQVRWHRW